MATKAQIIAYITSKLTGLGATKTTRAEHENLLFNNASSVLESVYMTPIQEVSSGTHLITVPNSNFSYTASFVKIGRKVFVNGKFTALATVSPTTVMSIDPLLTDYVTSTGPFEPLPNFVATNKLDFSTIGLGVDNNLIYTTNTVVIGEVFAFSLNYNTLN